MTADIYKALPYYLIHNAGLIAVLSTRIYPLKLPQGETLPAIFYQDVSTVSNQAHNEKSFLPGKRFQFTSVGGTVASVNLAAAALKAALDGLNKTSIGISPYITEVTVALFKNELRTDDPETGLFWCQQDFLIIYKE